MAEKIPDWVKSYPNKGLYDRYDTQRSYLIDTAETPEDQKNLKRDLEKLRKEYEAAKKSPTLNKTLGDSIAKTFKPIKPGPKPTVKVTSKAAPKSTTKKPAIRKPAVKRSSAKPVPLAPAPKRPAPTSTNRRPATPKTTKKAPGKMTPQDSAMKKILEKKYGKIYG